MPGLFRRSNSPYWWLWFVQDGRRTWRSSRTKSKTQAYAELNSILLRIKRGEKVARPQPATSIEFELRRRLSDQEASGRKAPATARKDYVRLKSFFVYCESHDIRSLEEIDSPVLQHFLAWLPQYDRRVSPVTANRYVDAVRGLLPAKLRVVKNRENESIGQEIPEEIFKKILAHADPVFRSFLILLAETGLRTGHLAMVETSWIRKTGKTFYIDFPVDRINQRKNAPQLPLTPTAIKVISKIPSGHYLFESDFGTPLYNSNRVHELWRQIRKKIGHSYRPHDIRHTFAIRELLRTGNPAYVQRMLGHSTPMTTMRIYQRLSLLRMTDLVAGANPSGIKKLP